VVNPRRAKQSTQIDAVKETGRVKERENKSISVLHLRQEMLKARRTQEHSPSPSIERKTEDGSQHDGDNLGDGSSVSGSLLGSGSSHSDDVGKVGGVG